MKRSFQHILALVLCLALCLPLCACTGEGKSRTKRVSALGGLADITAYGKNAAAALPEAEAALTSVDAMVSTFDENSRIYAVNHADGKAVVVTAQVASMIETARTVSKQTDGALDLTVYPLMDAWGFLSGSYTVPDEDTIAELLTHIGMNRVNLSADQESGDYMLQLPADVQITLDCVARGAATNAAINAMRAKGVKSAVISMGGNVQTLGLKPDGSKWNIAIMDPNDRNAYIGYLPLGETAVVTSSPTELSFTQRGALYHHIMNPETGMPASTAIRSMTVVCADAQMADCLSTAMFVLGERKALQYWRDHHGFEMLIITQDGRITCTNGLYGAFTQTGGDYKVSYLK